VRWTRLTAALAFLVHLPIAAPYGFFRDELYFIACGRRPSFGYVDQPPLVPLLAAATQAFGHNLGLIRAVAGLSHAALVLAVAALAARFEKRAGPLAGLMALLSPMFLGLHAILNTTVFEPLAWTLFALFSLRAVEDHPRYWLWAGLVAGVALEAKYAIPFFAVPLLLGLMLSGQRRALFTWQAAAGVALAAAVAAPSAIWQLTHGLPFLQLMHAAKEKNELVAPLTFVVNQLLVMNPLLAPIWLAGIVYGFLQPRARFLAIGFIGVFAGMLLLHGKDYYVAPAYGVAFALGAVALVRWSPWGAVRGVWLAGAAAFAGVAAPLALPLLPPETLVRYMAAIHQTPQQQEKLQRGVQLPAEMADMLGWPEMAEKVAAVWRALPDRREAGIFTANYGEAGALQFFGDEEVRSHVRSGHNQYWLWSANTWALSHDSPRVLVVVGRFERWQTRCKSLEVAGQVGGPWVMPYENRPILICRDLYKPLSSLWPDLQIYE
jgi:hypothetical protein